MSEPTAAPNCWPYMSHRTIDQVRLAEDRIAELELVSRYCPLRGYEERELAALRRELVA